MNASMIAVPRKSKSLTCLALAVTVAGSTLHAATIWQFDDFNNQATAGDINTGDNSARSGWKNVQGLTDLNDAVALPGPIGQWGLYANIWDRAGDGEAANTAIRVRFTSAQITTDTAMPLVSLSATSATISWDYAPDDADYNVGLYYASDADTSTVPLQLLQVFNGSQATAYVWQSASVTITDGVDGITFTDDARFVFKYHSGSNNGNADDQYFDNIQISYVPEPSAALLGLTALGLMLRRRRA